MVVLGVTIHDRLSFKPHIENLINRCAQTFYALQVLKSQGLNSIALWDVGQAILINRLLYASPVWWGFTDASDKQRLQAVITRAQRLGFCHHPRHHYRNSVGKLMTLSSLPLFVTNIMCCMVSSHQSNPQVTSELSLMTELSSLMTLFPDKISSTAYQ